MSMVVYRGILAINPARPLAAGAGALSKAAQNHLATQDPRIRGSVGGKSGKLCGRRISPATGALGSSYSRQTVSWSLRLQRFRFRDRQKTDRWLGWIQGVYPGHSGCPKPNPW